MKLVTGIIIIIFGVDYTTIGVVAGYMHLHIPNDAKYKFVRVKMTAMKNVFPYYAHTEAIVSVSMEKLISVEALLHPIFCSVFWLQLSQLWENVLGWEMGKLPGLISSSFFHPGKLI